MNKKECILVTGGAGFIGSALIRYLVDATDALIVNVDALTYAGNLESLSSIKNKDNYRFEQINICDAQPIGDLFDKYKPTAVMHLAAESHVDRSIDGPAAFIETNIVGTYNLLEAARDYWNKLAGAEKENFRFHHISTDEVFGSLPETGLFTETSPYQPNSPYSASKAASDHLVRAWHHTYGFPVLLTNCSNNYGPYQFPEKLIPLIILNALEGKPLPVYGAGDNVRDWLYVDDHLKTLKVVIDRGVPGETYNIGGNNEKTNLEVISTVCALLDEMVPESQFRPHEGLVEFVADRPGHDKRYAIDASKMKSELEWEPEETFESGMRKTVEWYLNNKEWCQHVQDGSYQRERLGVSK